MAAAGCLFAVSAFESASDHILEQLDKGHTAAEEARGRGGAARGGHRAPTVVAPLHPLDACRGRVRAARPRGALRSRRQRRPGAVRHPAARPPRLAPGHLGAARRSARPLRRRASGMVVAGSRQPARRPPRTVLRPRTARRRPKSGPPRSPTTPCAPRAVAVLGEPAPGGAAAPEPDARLRSPIPADERPRLTEAWFCCAEPSGAQLAAVGVLDRDLAPVAAGGK